MKSMTLRALAGLGTAIVAPLLLSDYRSGQLSLFCCLAVLAVSLDLVWGYTGILSLGQLLPFGTAAYTTALITTEHPSLSPASLAVSVALGAGISAAVGAAAFSRRLSPVVVGLLTLMLSLTFEQIAEQWRNVTGGFNGVTGVPRIEVLGAELSDSAQDWLITLLCAVAVAAVGILVRRPIGAVLIGVRDNERRMEAFGYHTVAIKIWVFTLGGAVAAFAGVLYAHRTGFVSPGVFGFTMATNMVLWTLIGGRATIIGPVVGTLLINFATAALSAAWLQYWVLLTGAMLVLATAFVPDGLVPTALRLAGRPSRRPSNPQFAPTRTSGHDDPATSQGAQGERYPSRGRSTDATGRADAVFDASRSATDAHNELVDATGRADAVFDASGVSKSFGDFEVLSDVTLTMRSPELLCLIGPNGAGKSTLLDILCGSQSCEAGSLSILGEDLSGQSAVRFARRGVARKFQIPEVIGSLSVAENIAVAAWSRTRRSPWRLCISPWQAELPEGTRHILEHTGLNARATEPARALSHGHKQWLETAMALAGECRLLLLDEPTAGMTVTESLQAADLLRRLHSSLRLPVVVVEHDMGFIRAVADRVSVLARGTLISDGAVADVEASPEVRAVYLGNQSAGQ